MPYPDLPWMGSATPFPPVEQSWDANSPAPGLLAAGEHLDADMLQRAYHEGIFPWFSDGQPVLWWSTDPRMVLRPAEFKLSLSLRKQIKNLLRQNRLEVRMDADFTHVMHNCADSVRRGQSGTWISPKMVAAYSQLHQRGHAHSVETWLDGARVGGLYLVNIGGMVFGESMYSRVSNASKIALAALVGFCLYHELALIDCQQETSHLASLGAHPMPRRDFVQNLSKLVNATPPKWHFHPGLWQVLMSTC